MKRVQSSTDVTSTPGNKQTALVLQKFAADLESAVAGAPKEVQHDPLTRELLQDMQDAAAKNKSGVVRVLVLGTLGTGKSEIVNRLLLGDWRSKSCRKPLVSHVGGSSVTKALFEVSYNPSHFVVRYAGTARAFQDLEGLHEHLLHFEKEPPKGVVVVEGPWPGLRDNFEDFVLVDTPGIGSNDVANETWAREFAKADVVLVLASRLDLSPWAPLVEAGAFSQSTLPGMLVHGCFWGKDNLSLEHFIHPLQDLLCSYRPPGQQQSELEMELSMTRLFGDYSRFYIVDRAKPMFNMLAAARDTAIEASSDRLLETCHKVQALLQHHKVPVGAARQNIDELIRCAAERGDIWLPYPCSFPLALSEAILSNDDDAGRSLKIAQSCYNEMAMSFERYGRLITAEQCSILQFNLDHNDSLGTVAPEGTMPESFIALNIARVGCAAWADANIAIDITQDIEEARLEFRARFKEADYESRAFVGAWSDKLDSKFVTLISSAARQHKDLVFERMTQWLQTQLRMIPRPDLTIPDVQAELMSRQFVCWLCGGGCDEDRKPLRFPQNAEERILLPKGPIVRRPMVLVKCIEDEDSKRIIVTTTQAGYLIQWSKALKTKCLDCTLGTQKELTGFPLFCREDFELPEDISYETVAASLARHLGFGWWWDSSLSHPNELGSFFLYAASFRDRRRYLTSGPRLARCSFDDLRKRASHQLVHCCTALFDRVNLIFKHNMEQLMTTRDETLIMAAMMPMQSIPKLMHVLDKLKELLPQLHEMLMEFCGPVLNIGGITVQDLPGFSLVHKDRSEQTKLELRNALFQAPHHLSTLVCYAEQAVASRLHQHSFKSLLH